MKFSDINFGDSGRKKRPGLGLVVPGGFWVAKTTFELAWAFLKAERPNWDLTKEQTAKTLCNPIPWGKHGGGSRCHSLGRAVKYFAVNEMIPWEESNPGKSGNRKYRYKP